MSKLREKSNFNLDGAELLIQNDIYAPSVHCSYYAVLQKISYIYLRKVGISAEELKSEVDVNGGSTHRYITTKFFALYGGEPRLRYDIRDIKNMLKDLKTFRVKSDYHDVEITYDMSSSALEKSKDIIRILKAF